ncbi:MAG: HDOD domain-containing protein, partial [Pseudomonadota bacterium]
AFVAGLMHDVGKVVLNNEAPDSFRQSLELSQKEMQPSFDAEQDIFSLNHNEVGMVLTNQWGLSPAIVQSAFLHHDLELAESTADEHLTLINVIHLANIVCHKLGIGTEPSEDIQIEDNQAAQTLGVRGIQAEDLLEKTKAAFVQERALFD